MTRRAFVGTAVSGTLASAARGVTAATEADTQGERRTDLVIDASAPMAAPTRGPDSFRTELRARRAAGVDIAFVPVADREGLDATLRNLLALRSYIARLESEAVLVTGTAEIAQVRPRVGVVGQFQGLQMVGEQLHLIESFRQAGVLVMQLTGYWKNWNADGCLEPGNRGLTGLGRMVVHAITEAGVVLDLAQLGRKSSFEALDISTGPIIVSRANAAAIHDHPQNLTDRQIDAVREHNGVIGVSVFPPLLSLAGRPTIEDVLRQLRYLIDRAGIDHVAIGLDFDDRPRRRFTDEPLPDPPYAYPIGLASIGDVPAFRNRLIREGLTVAEVQKLFGENLARVLGQVLG